MEELIKRFERVIATGAPDKDGMHPISAETVLEVVKELSEHGTNLAEVGTDCISRQAAIDALDCINGVEEVLRSLPPAQPETTRRIVGRSKGGMTLWYECERCGEPVDEGDKFCRGCGAKMEVTT